MIFVTVGTQLPFDRMIRAIDEWAAGRRGHAGAGNGDGGGGAEVFAQIGPSAYRPRHIGWTQFLGADACREKTRAARLIVAHAGMGSIITALELGKPILVMPRRMALGEQRNDHQLATVEQLVAQRKVTAAYDERELIEKLDHLEQFQSAVPISNRARPELLAALRRFVDGPLGIEPEPIGQRLPDDALVELNQSR